MTGDADSTGSTPPAPESVPHLGDTPRPPQTGLASPQAPSEPPWGQLPPPPRRTSRLAIWCLALALAPLPLGVVLVAADATGSVWAALAGLAGLASYVASVTTGIVAIRRIKRSSGLLKGMGLAIAGIGWVALALVGGIALNVTSNDVLLRDDFEGVQNFSTDDDPHVSLRYAHGGYEMLIKDPVAPQEARTFFDEPAQPALSFAADATMVQGPEENMAIGLACYPTANTGYVLAISPTGQYFVFVSFRDREAEPLTEGQANPLRGPGEANRLSITCRGGGSAPTMLQLSVNGEEVVRYIHPDGHDSFIAVGFFVATEEAGTLVRFDDALAERA